LLVVRAFPESSLRGFTNDRKTLADEVTREPLPPQAPPHITRPHGQVSVVKCPQYAIVAFHIAYDPVQRMRRIPQPATQRSHHICENKFGDAIMETGRPLGAFGIRPTGR
jgi:hypothetical protein